MSDDRSTADLAYWPGRPTRSAQISVAFARPIDDRLVGLIRAFVCDSFARLGAVGLQHVVVGLSGGLDSVVSAVLCRDALGADRVTAVTVDLGIASHAAQTKDASRTAEDLGLTHRVIDASKLHAQSSSLLAEQGPFTSINVATRVIHGTLFQFADAHMAGVVSTVDRSEELLARHMECFYGHFAPLATLYKSEVVELATRLRVPDRVIRQEPGCADFWKDQEVLGAGYEVIDPILHLLVDKEWSADRIAAKYGLDQDWVSRIERRVRSQPARMTTRVFHE